MKNFIHPTAQIGPNVAMGHNNYIGPFCVIGYPAEHKDFWGGNTGRVIIGDNNNFTGHVTIDAGTERATIIGDGNWFLKHSHAGHDVLVGNDNTVSCGVKIGGHTEIGNGNNFGLNAVIHQRQRILNNCMIGMGAVITSKILVETHSKYVGNPARYLSPNIKK